MKQRKVRRLSIKTKVLLFTSFIMIILIILLGLNIYSNIQKNMIQMGIEQAESSAKNAVHQIDTEEVSNIKVGDENTAAYQENQLILLAGEAEKMLLFMEETVFKGYSELLSMGEKYSDDAVTIHKMMDKLSHNSEKIRESMNIIKVGIKEVNIAVEESTKGIMNISGNSTELSENMKDIEEKADINKKIVVKLQNEVHKFKVE